MPGCHRRGVQWPRQPMVIKTIIAHDDGEAMEDRRRGDNSGHQVRGSRTGAPPPRLYSTYRSLRPTEPITSILRRQ